MSEKNGVSSFFENNTRNILINHINRNILIVQYEVDLAFDSTSLTRYFQEKILSIKPLSS